MVVFVPGQGRFNDGSRDCVPSEADHG
jgi:hypothetical protein